jgi:hypothetical protein
MTSSSAIRRTSVLVLVAAMAASIVPFAPSAGAATKNPCKVLTRNEVKKVYDQPVAAPKRDDVGKSKQCAFEVSGGMFEAGGLNVTVALARGSLAIESFEDAKTAAANSGGFAFVTGVGVDTSSGSDPCLGDCAGAIFYSSPTGVFQTLWVRTKNGAFAVGVTLSAPPEGAVESAEPLFLQPGDPLASELDNLTALAKKARTRV